MKKVHPEKVQKFDCEYCERYFYSSDELLEHVARKHSTVKRFKCALCPSVFALNTQLTAHVKASTEKKDNTVTFATSLSRVQSHSMSTSETNTKVG